MAIDPVPAMSTSIGVDWELSADVSPGWTVELGTYQAGDGTGGQAWAGAGSARLVGVDQFSRSGDSDEGHISLARLHTVQFGIRLTAPPCGGPVEPEISVSSFVVSHIDGIAGTESYNRTVLPVQPVLLIEAPTATLNRTMVGVLVDPSNP